MVMLEVTNVNHVFLETMRPQILQILLIITYGVKLIREHQTIRPILEEKEKAVYF
jgi:hypothetical protein